MHRLENLRMKNSPDIDSVGLDEVIWFFKGLTAELNKVQNENDLLKKEVSTPKVVED